MGSNSTASDAQSGAGEEFRFITYPDWCRLTIRVYVQSIIDYQKVVATPYLFFI